jgi:uncharacterized protein
MKKRYIDWWEYQGMVAEVARQISLTEWRPELIIGITRGGAQAAVMLSHYFDCKMIGMDVALRDTYKNDRGPESNGWAATDAMDGHKILIVDDINDSGSTINWIIKDWELQPKLMNLATQTDEYKIKWGENVRFAVLLDNSASKSEVTPTYCAETINKHEDPIWIVFPYEEWWTK